MSILFWLLFDRCSASLANCRSDANWLVRRALVLLKFLFREVVGHFKYVSRIFDFLIDLAVRATERVSVDVKQGDWSVIILHRHESFLRSCRCLLGFIRAH